MKKKTAVVSFLGICIVLAVLLLTDIITPFFGGCVFAVALVVVGGVSRGFRK